MQSRIDSLWESMHNTWIGFLLSITVQQFLVAPLLGATMGAQCKPGPVMNFIVTMIFTVVSVARNYGIRRYNVYKLTHGVRNLQEVLSIFIKR